MHSARVKALKRRNERNAILLNIDSKKLLNSFTKKEQVRK